MYRPLFGEGSDDEPEQGPASQAQECPVGVAEQEESKNVEAGTPQPHEIDHPFDFSGIANIAPSPSPDRGQTISQALTRVTPGPSAMTPTDFTYKSLKRMLKLRINQIVTSNPDKKKSLQKNINTIRNRIKKRLPVPSMQQPRVPMTDRLHELCTPEQFNLILATIDDFKSFSDADDEAEWARFVGLPALPPAFFEHQKAQKPGK